MSDTLGDMGRERDYTVAKMFGDIINAEVTVAGAVLDAFPKTTSGMTPDNVRATSEWRTAKARYDTAFAKLRTFNTQFMRLFRAEIREERRNRKAAR